MAVRWQLPVATLVRRFELWLRQYRGRIAEGRGNHGIGDLLPGLFAGLGLRQIAVFDCCGR